MVIAAVHSQVTGKQGNKQASSTVHCSHLFLWPPKNTISQSTYTLSLSFAAEHVPADATVQHPSSASCHVYPPVLCPAQQGGVHLRLPSVQWGWGDPLLAGASPRVVHPLTQHFHGWVLWGNDITSHSFSLLSFLLLCFPHIFCSFFLSFTHTKNNCVRNNSGDECLLPGVYKVSELYESEKVETNGNCLQGI